MSIHDCRTTSGTARERLRVLYTAKLKICLRRSVVLLHRSPFMFERYITALANQHRWFNHADVKLLDSVGQIFHTCWCKQYVMKQARDALPPLNGDFVKFLPVADISILSPIMIYSMVGRRMHHSCMIGNTKCLVMIHVSHQWRVTFLTFSNYCLNFVV